MATTHVPAGLLAEAARRAAVLLPRTVTLGCEWCAAGKHSVCPNHFDEGRCCCWVPDPDDTLDDPSLPTWHPHDCDRCGVVFWTFDPGDEVWEFVDCYNADVVARARARRGR